MLECLQWDRKLRIPRNHLLVFPVIVHTLQLKVFSWTGKLQEGAWLPFKTMERKLSALKQSLNANAFLGWSGSSPIFQFDNDVLSAVKLLCLSHLRLSNHEHFSGEKVSQLEPVWKTNDSPSPEPALSSLWEWRSAMIIFYLISFHSLTPPYTPQAAWSSPWKEKLVRKSKRPFLWDARISGVSWEGTQWALCWSMDRPQRRATVVPPTPLWKMGCSSNVCYGLETEIAMPDLPGLCYVWSQMRWSFLALKFS